MSVLTPISKLAVIGSGVAIIGLATSQFCSFGPEPLIEPGYVNPRNVELYSPKNEKGNLELYLSYLDGESNAALPVMAGPYGPVVGTPEYNWRSMDNLIKSELVGNNWYELDVDARKSIIKNDLEKMLETYGGQ